jgi:hypothetical protein
LYFRASSSLDAQPASATAKPSGDTAAVENTMATLRAKLLVAKAAKESAKNKAAKESAKESAINIQPVILSLSLSLSLSPLLPLPTTLPIHS